MTTRMIISKRLSLPAVATVVVPTVVVATVVVVGGIAAKCKLNDVSCLQFALFILYNDKNTVLN